MAQTKWAHRKTRCRFARALLPTLRTLSMNLTLTQIQEEMSASTLNPMQCADFRTYLAAVYSNRSERLQKILALKPVKWLSIRAGKNSDRAADREWEASEDGIEEMKLNMELKRIDKLSSALSSKLRVFEAEAKNQM